MSAVKLATRETVCCRTCESLPSSGTWPTDSPAMAFAAGASEWRSYLIERVDEFEEGDRLTLFFREPEYQEERTVLRKVCDYRYVDAQGPAQVRVAQLDDGKWLELSDYGEDWYAWLVHQSFEALVHHLWISTGCDSAAGAVVALAHLGLLRLDIGEMKRQSILPAITRHTRLLPGQTLAR